MSIDELPPELLLPIAALLWLLYFGVVLTQRGQHRRLDDPPRDGQADDREHDRQREGEELHGLLAVLPSGFRSSRLDEALSSGELSVPIDGPVLHAHPHSEVGKPEPHDRADEQPEEHHPVHGWSVHR